MAQTADRIEGHRNGTSVKALRLANFILDGGGIFCLTFLLYLVARHGWSGHYLWLIVFASALFAGLRTGPSFRINLVLFLLSTGLFTYSGELVFAFIEVTNPWHDATRWVKLPYDEELAAELAKRAILSGVAFDTRTRLEVITDLRASGVDSYPAITPRVFFWESPIEQIEQILNIDGVGVLPLGGIANKVTVLCNEIGEYVIYKSDEHGFHNPKRIWSARTINIGVVGDSFAQGYCVPSNKNFVALIRRQYPTTLNLAAAGSGPLLELAAIREYLTFVKPKLVLWFYCEGNDFSDLALERKSPFLMQYLLPTFSQGLLGRQIGIDQALTAHVETIMRARDLPSRIRKLIKQVHDSDYLPEEDKQVILYP